MNTHINETTRTFPTIVPQAETVEVCALLVGRCRDRIWVAERLDLVSGSPVEVEFDASAALRREEEHGDLIGFYHTHPHGDPTPSLRDLRTMRAWVATLGKPLLCVIEAPDRIQANIFIDDESAPVPAVDILPDEEGSMIVVG